MWTILYKGTQRTFASLGLADLIFSFKSGTLDDAAFSAIAGDFDGEALFDYNEATKIYRDGVCWFAGRCSTVPRSGTPDEERLAYRILGPWWALQRIEFQQLWNSDAAPHAETVVILGKDIHDDRITCGAQIKEVLDYAITQGAEFQYLEADLAALDIIPPDSEETDITCEEAIRNMLRWHKDVTTTFDYSTDLPTLRFISPASATAVSFDVDQGAPNETIQILRRTDIEVRGVVLNYVTTNNVNGNDYRAINIDAAGETTGLDIVRMTIALQGYSLSTQEEKIVTEEIPEDTTAKNAKIDDLITAANPWLLDASIRKLDFASREISSDLDHILVSGTLDPEWMTVGNDPVSVEDGTLPAIVTITYTNGLIDRQTITCNQTFTNASTKNYSRTTSYTPGEGIPVGLALKIFNQLNQPHFQGDASFLQVECTGLARPGHRLNLTGGIAEWQTMNATIQEVTESIEDGQTSITFGPAEHLAVQDFLELIRANRMRKPSRQSNVRSTGLASNNNSKISRGGFSKNSSASSGASWFGQGFFEVVSVHDEYLLCAQVVRFTPSGTPVFSEEETETLYAVAIPPQFRRSTYDGKTIAGITYVWQESGTRKASNDTDDEYQTITPDYVARDGAARGEIITAAGKETGLQTDASADIFLEDTNTSGRSWALNDNYTPPA